MHQIAKQPKLISWIPVFVWMALIFYLSHQPASSSNELSTGVMDVFIHTITTVIPIDFDLGIFHHFIRKSAHFFAYFMLGLLVINALKRHVSIKWKFVALSLIICILYAISDEVHQLFILGRSGEMRDVFIDSTGSATGIAVYILLSKTFRKIRSLISKSLNKT